MGKQERAWEHLLGAAHPGTPLQRFHLGMGQHHCFCSAPARVVGLFLGPARPCPSTTGDGDGEAEPRFGLLNAGGVSRQRLVLGVESPGEPEEG